MKTNPRGEEPVDGCNTQQPCCGAGRPVTALELMLVIAYQADPIPSVVVPNDPEVSRITRDWIERGYLIEHRGMWVATDALSVWIDALAQVPRPSQVTKWVNRGGG